MALGVVALFEFRLCRTPCGTWPIKADPRGGMPLRTRGVVHIVCFDCVGPAVKLLLPAEPGGRRPFAGLMQGRGLARLTLDRLCKRPRNR